MSDKHSPCFTMWVMDMGRTLVNAGQGGALHLVPAAPVAFGEGDLALARVHAVKAALVDGATRKSA